MSQSHTLPKVSIVIPTWNSASSIGITLDHLLGQEYPDFEVIIVDALSTDRTLEVIRSYHNSHVQIYSVTHYQRYEMLNRGISLSTGSYINFLYPGDFYIHSRVLKEIMELGAEHGLPPLIYSATLLRDGRKEVKLLCRAFNQELLKKGQQPTSLQACWFRLELFQLLGKFPLRYRLRGGFDLLCRFSLHKELRSVYTTHAFTDYDLRGVTRKMILYHFLETFRSIYRHFGLSALLSWVWSQKDTGRMFDFWKRSLKKAFLGKR
jgi:glycosyltransferase involved in cell wall biosynthesis